MNDNYVETTGEYEGRFLSPATIDVDIYSFEGPDGEYVYAEYGNEDEGWITIENEEWIWGLLE